MPKDSDQQAGKDPKKAMAEALRQALKNKAAHQTHNDTPGTDFAGKGGKGAKQAAPKARNFRHQGR
jgi:hypothetical protein